tara:strand:+ start:990 stop:1337 length:348 start_codon:yes stop_codon:yes gene_type:complete
MGTSKDILIEKIYDLKEENKELKVQKEELEEYIRELQDKLHENISYTYIHETHNLWCQDGEMHIGYSDVDDEKWLVYNTEQLFKDLPFIINQVVKENKKMQDMYLTQIKDELKEL